MWAMSEPTITNVKHLQIYDTGFSLASFKDSFPSTSVSDYHLCSSYELKKNANDFNDGCIVSGMDYSNEKEKCPDNVAFGLSSAMTASKCSPNNTMHNNERKCCPDSVLLSLAFFERRSTSTPLSTVIVNAIQYNYYMSFVCCVFYFLIRVVKKRGFQALTETNVWIGILLLSFPQLPKEQNHDILPTDEENQLENDDEIQGIIVDTNHVHDNELPDPRCIDQSSWKQ